MPVAVYAVDGVIGDSSGNFFEWIPVGLSISMILGTEREFWGLYFKICKRYISSICVCDPRYF